MSQPETRSSVEVLIDGRRVGAFRSGFNRTEPVELEQRHGAFVATQAGRRLGIIVEPTETRSSYLAMPRGLAGRPARTIIEAAQQLAALGDLSGAQFGYLRHCGRYYRQHGPAATAKMLEYHSRRTPGTGARIAALVAKGYIRRGPDGGAEVVL